MSSADGNCNLIFNLQHIYCQIQISSAVLLLKGLFKDYVVMKVGIHCYRKKLS